MTVGGTKRRVLGNVSGFEWVSGVFMIWSLIGAVINGKAIGDFFFYLKKKQKR